MKHRVNLATIVEQFGSEDKCREYLGQLRWPQGVVCPRCNSDRILRIKDRHQHHCHACQYQFSVTAGTILHDSHLPLWKWFATAYMMVESKKGVSANQIKREMNISYKTAWYLCHRIRSAMASADKPLLSGILEADETLVGGEAPGKGHGYIGNKTTVAGTVSRGGDIRLQVVPNRSRETLHAFVRQHAHDDATAIYTDDLPSYVGIGDHNTTHDTVNHSKEEYVRGDVHTNTVEGVWSLLERSIIGSFHQVSKKHLDAYLDELEFRFGNRNNPHLFRETIKRLISADVLKYETLIEKEAV